ncbi:MAG TPA: hypothetical protein VE755_07750, partial [Myxococcales bacterium]|nr:hypothetical protein [Myxococcales bacterium]
MLRRLLGILALCVACGSTEKPALLAADQSSVQFTTIAVGDTSDEASIRVSNAGAATTAALVTSFGGQDPDAFILASDGCRGTALAAGASCDVHLLFRPSAERQFSAELI